MLRDCEIRSVKEVRGGARSMWLASEEGMLSAIAFRPGPLVEVLTVGNRLSLIGRLDRNDWNGQSRAQFIVEDAWLGFAG